MTNTKIVDDSAKLNAYKHNLRCDLLIEPYIDRKEKNMTPKMGETDLSKKDLLVFEYILKHGKDIVWLLSIKCVNFSWV